LPKLRESVAKQKLQEQKWRERRIRLLKREWALKGDRQIFNEVLKEQQQLILDRRENYYRQSFIAAVLARRLEVLLQGHICHSSNIKSRYLGTKNV
jgi:hypothetical protein